VTLLDALSIIRSVYEEDDAEREALLDALWPILLGDKTRLTSALMAAWPDSSDEICEVIAEYQAARTKIDAEITAADLQRMRPTDHTDRRKP
jgi:hypothetical protein